ncbi:RPC7 polymerase, partial [Columbina picui]|nr:RPC7 polymerase [Columbina picui]
MAGSGRGREHAAFTFDIGAVGFSKGEALPDAVSEPPPPFPSTDNKPVPLKTGEDEDYMLALKQDLRGTMQRLPYFLAVEEDCEGLFEDYCSKSSFIYIKAVFCTDWRRLPREMKPRKKTKKGRLYIFKEYSVHTSLVIEEILELIWENKWQKSKDNEEEQSEDEQDKMRNQEDEDDEEAEEPEEYDEEVHEEENDYISSYFEDGDDFGAGSDDNMDEATY